VAFEHTTASLNGAPLESYPLRVTTVFRRKDGEWRVAHRHGDWPKSRADFGLAEHLQASDR
jgi:ketosteroid isomerase-like protein